MNLALLQKSRRTPQTGDIFAMYPPDGKFLYGRVISTDAPGPMRTGCILVYVYSVRSAMKIPAPTLLREQLLIPPVMTNRLPWSRGYFEHIENRSLLDTDRLAQHCFRDTRGWYFDEYGSRLQTATAPVGSWGLGSFRTIDDGISKALGIPLSTDG